MLYKMMQLLTLFEQSSEFFVIFFLLYMYKNLQKKIQFLNKFVPESFVINEIEIFL